ncbi:CaiB/BaiF CoA transferase family protein [Thermodesulfobacteriota bacterium]
MDSLLQSLKVLDLTDEKGLLAGRVLADFGADVIKIEKPGGDDARSIGPFYNNTPDKEKSLFWFAHNLNKRSITLNIETRDGQQIFKDLVAKADVVIESFQPGHLDKIGLGYHSLEDINPAIIMASVTPFGQTGPYRDYVASDIVIMAMSGHLYLSGDPDRPPVRFGVPQASLNGALEAATGVMIALYYRDFTGEGQHVDVSMQQSLGYALVQTVPFWVLDKNVLERSGHFRVGLTSNTRQRQTWPCKDGMVNFVIYGGLTGSHVNRALVDWMDEEGMCPDYLKNIDFNTWDVFNITQEGWKDIEGPIGEFFFTHTKAELLEEGVKRQCPICPVSSPSEVANYSQLMAREFWLDVEHPELGTTIMYPGFFGKLSETPCRLYRRPPLIGEHNMEIYQDLLGLSEKEIVMLKQANII